MVVLIKASSTGLLLKTTGLKVTSIKIDPYMNIDAGTMARQNMVYVLNDGGEVDLDLGNYERYLNVTLSRDNNLTTGKIYREVIEKEVDWIERVSKVPVDDTGEEPDVCIVELGGTVGDIESAPFIEAMRQFQFRVGHANFALIHVSLVPDMHGEQKTKPTQATIRDLRGLDSSYYPVRLLLVVSAQPLDAATKSKISMFCHVAPEQVVGVHDLSSVYHVPLLLESQGIIQFLQKRLDLLSVRIPPALVEKGHDLANRWKILTQTTLTCLSRSPSSILHLDVIGNLFLLGWNPPTLSPKHFESNPVRYHDAWRALVGAQGILVPGGFGSRGTEGMVLAIKWAREQKVPFLGFASASRWPLSNHAPSRHRIYAGDLQDPSGRNHAAGAATTLFNQDSASCRTAYVDRIAESGLEFIGKDEAGVRMQILELRDHPYFVGLQAHPEFCTRPLNPSPPFLGLVAAASGKEVLREQIQNQRNYVSPHPVSAQVLEYTPTVREAGCNIGGSETPRVIQD
ncbi:CTP synthase [Rhizoctonia solani]|uniref:CTP synthase n=1 Tax=Rhizoctonia solani TaxID=456999 RepID=A0A8H7IBD7_9AGAM|nr:CTP synthase [Rhizoctonia solani]